MNGPTTVPAEAIKRRDRRGSGAAPIVAYGADAVLRLPGLVAASGARRIMLVCGRSSFAASGAEAMLPALEQCAAVHRWSDFAANTDSADLRTGLAVMREIDPDLVLGIGGGSAMDMAKLLCVYRDVPGDGLTEAITSGRKTESRRNRLMLVPTTSGSGSEATHFAVVYIGDAKYSIAGAGMRPNAIVLDPKLSTSSSPYQRATSGIDAVCQAIESMWATGATDRSRFFARIALRLLLPAIERFVHEPEPAAARAMCIGSHFAGRAIDISRTTAAHALSYGITKTYGVSHGHAAALTLGGFLAAHADATAAELRDGVDPAVHAAAVGEVLAALDAADGQNARRRFTALMRRIGLDPSLTAAGASTQQARAALAVTVNTERLGNNPVAFTADELAGLVNEIE
ncbi:MAG: iron-containing alcohol dehydrogenase [Actinophytocola sp.]|nr:iron-containing alcohol dehydrogenase [Actinophytocola sp.]